ncbi:MAG: hypothetical protein R3D45_11685 [Rhizobiaceae bacterium]
MGAAAFEEILRLVIRHGYYGDDPAPLRAVLVDSRLAWSEGMRFRPEADGVSVWVTGDAERPDSLAIALMPETPETWAVTAGFAAGETQAFDLPFIGKAREAVRIADIGGRKVDIHGPARPMATMNFGLPPTGARRLEVRFDAVETGWTYHITGFERFGALSVVDRLGEIVFAAIDAPALPDGRAVMSFCADAPLALSARPQPRFELRETTGTGVDTLIAALPSAGTTIRPIAGEPGFVSDIYFSL